MTYQINISNRVNKKLKELKGKNSYSSVIEDLMRKCGIIVALDDLPQQPSTTASDTPEKRGTPT